MASKKVSGSAARELAEAIRGTQTKAKQATVAYGTVTQAGAEAYVTLDGATSATPVSETAAALSVGDRVAVRIEGGSMAVTGNMTAPATSQAAVAAEVSPVKAQATEAVTTAQKALEEAQGRKVAYSATAYQLSADGSEQPTGEWLDEAPAQTDAKPYLWCRNTVGYADGTSAVFCSVTKMGSKGLKGDPGEDGVAGAKGADGKTSYLHIAYATSADGKSGFSTSDSTGKTYIGQYTDFAQADSTDSTAYAWTLIKGEKGDKGATGATGAAGKDGQMLLATCSTAGATAAKVATLASGSLSLATGATVTVKFTNANTAAVPTLDVSGTGAKAIRTDSTGYAYWVAGAAITFAFDGTYWNVCSPAVYADTATIGNPSAANVYINGTSVSIRDNGTRELAKFRTRSGFTDISSSQGMMLYSGTADVPQGVFLTAPPASDGTETDIGVGLVSGDSDGAVNMKFYAAVNKAEFVVSDGIHMSGSKGDGPQGFYDYRGRPQVVLAGDYGNTTIGYYNYVNKDANTNVYGNSVNLVANDSIRLNGPFCKSVSASSGSFDVANNSSANKTVTLNAGSGWTLVGITRFTNGNSNCTTAGFNVTSNSGGKASVIGYVRNESGSKRSCNITFVGMFVHAGLA